jgi:hypothetical protein
MKIDLQLLPALRFDGAIVSREHGIGAQPGQTGGREVERDAEGLVQQVRGAGVEKHLSGRVDPGNAPFGIEHDERTGHRCDQCLGRRAGRNRRQAAARESHGS